MRPTIRLGRIAGIEVGIHWSLLVIGVLLVGSLAGGELPALAPHAHGSYLAAAVLAVVFFFASILAHELADSIVARRQGQAVDGITLWLLGGVSKLGTEATSAGDEFRVAIAGPGHDARARGVSSACSRSCSTRSLAPGTLLPTVAVWLAVVNLILGVFNLLPGAPLDGGRVLTAMLWKRNGDRRRSQISAARAGRVARRDARRRLTRAALRRATTPSSPRWSASSCSARRVQEESSARLLRTLDDRPVGELMRPIPHIRPRLDHRGRFGPVTEPTLLLGWDGTPTALLPPGAVFAVPPEAREHVQLRALGTPARAATRVSASTRPRPTS